MNRISGNGELGRQGQGLFLGPHHPLVAHLVGEDLQGVAQAGAHLLGLAQHGGEGLGLVDAQPVGQPAPDFLARPAGAQLQRQEPQVLGQVG